MTTNTLHAHTETHSADCDGSYTYTSIQRMTDEEVADIFSDLTFKQRILGNYVSVVPGIAVKVEVTVEGFDADETTDEGYRNVSVRWCEDECSEASTYWDHRAESMRY